MRSPSTLAVISLGGGVQSCVMTPMTARLTVYMQR